MIPNVGTDQDYRLYSSLCFDEMSLGEHNGESRFINDNSKTSGHDLRSANVNNVIDSPQGLHLSLEEDLPLSIVRRNIRPPEILSPKSEDYTIQAEPASPTPTVTTLNATYGQPGLIPYVGTTTNKFTRKWPRPKSLGHIDKSPKGVKGGNDGGMGASDSGGQSLEEGRFNLTYLYKWTPFKWCLFFSVICVFACGCGGLIVALMTWFNGQLRTVKSHISV